MEQYDALIRQIYRSVMGNEWHPFLEDICALLGGESAFLTWDASNSGSATVNMPLGRLGEVAAKLTQVNDYPSILDGNLDGVTRLDHGEAASPPLPRGSDWFREHHWVGGVIDGKNGEQIRLCLFRPPHLEPFSESHRKTFRSLFSHLIQGFGLRKQIIKEQSWRQTTQSIINSLGVGVILLDGDGKPVITNPMARELAKKCHGLTLSNCGLSAKTPGERETLAGLIDSAIATPSGSDEEGGGVTRVTCPSSRQPISVFVMPFGNVDRTHVEAIHAVVYLANPRQHPVASCDTLRALYNLTPAEGALAEGLAQGNTLQNYADDQGLALNTVRSRLKSVFQKTCTTRQSELIKVILTGPAMVKMTSHSVT